MSAGIYVLIEHQKGVVEDISYIMLAAAKQVAEKTGDPLVALLLGQECSALAQDLAADKVVYFEHPALQDFSPDAYLDVLAACCSEEKPRIFIAGHTSVGMDVVGGLATRLNYPVISQCQHFETVGETVSFACQICAGKIMAEGTLPDSGVMISMVPGGYKVDQGKAAHSPVIQVVEPQVPEPRIKLVEYIEPDREDIDISKVGLLVAVGRGLQNQADLELVEELAAGLGAEVCASRPIIDQGWLPISRLVGKSGKSVAPKAYLAMGISGAPEHVQSISDADMIIAINTDPAAPIFNIAQYGAEIDLIDFITAMLEHLPTAELA